MTPCCLKLPPTSLIDHLVSAQTPGRTSRSQRQRPDPSLGRWALDRILVTGAAAFTGGRLSLHAGPGLLLETVWGSLTVFPQELLERTPHQLWQGPPSHSACALLACPKSDLAQARRPAACSLWAHRPCCRVGGSKEAPDLRSLGSIIGCRKGAGSVQQGSQS